MAETEHKPRKSRSPSYPAYTLSDVIAKVKLLYDAQGRRAAPLPAVAEDMGGKITSSAFQLMLSAAKQFGLVEEQTTGSDHRRFRVSDLALDILEYEREDSPARWEAIRKAALSPRIHQELWEKYAGSLPKSDSTIRYYLVREREDAQFNKGAVEGFIAQFRQTLSFAKLTGDDTIGSSNGESPEHEPVPIAMQSARPEPTTRHDGFDKPAAPPAPPKGTRDFPLYTSESRGALYVPERMTAEDFKLLKSQIENSLAVIEATAVDKQPAGQFRSIDAD